MLGFKTQGKYFDVDLSAAFCGHLRIKAF